VSEANPIEFPRSPDAAERLDVVCDVLEEMKRQDGKWGEQNHPDGTGKDVAWPTNSINMGELADDMRWLCNKAAEGGSLTWLHIAAEEVFEGFAEETGTEELYAEVVQAGAVFLTWAQAMKRRKRYAAEAQTASELEASRRSGHRRNTGDVSPPLH
jgi:hypothetical protein